MSIQATAIIGDALIERVAAALDLASKVERGISTPDDELTLVVHLTVIHDDLPTLARIALGEAARAAVSQRGPQE